MPSLPREFIHKVWGKEEIVCNNEQYAGKILHLDKGAKCSVHQHKLKNEHFYLLDGVVELEIGDEKVLMIPGDCYEVKAGTLHSFKGYTAARIIEFSSHDDPEDSYRITTSIGANGC